MKYTASELEATFAGLLEDLKRAFDGAGVPWMLVGGLAVGAWTEPRGTKDVDLAIAAPTEIETLAAALAAVGLRVFRGALDTARSGGTVRMRLEREGRPNLVVDLLCAGTDFEHEALRRRRELKVFDVSVPIASPDDLLVFKLIAGRPQDLADVDRMIRTGITPEDEGYVRRWTEDGGVTDRLETAIRTAARNAE